MVSNIKFSHTGGSHIRSKTVFKNTTKDKVENFRSTHSAWHHSKNMRVSQNTGSEINKENKIASWIVNTLNPINHIPVIGTIKKLHSKAADSLDVVQSMIGGMLYGGPFGMIKGIGSWIAGKFINNNKLANKPTEVSKNYKQPINSFKAYTNNEKTNVLIGSRRHWRTINKTLCSFLTSKNLIEKHWNNFYNNCLDRHDPFEKYLNEIYKSEICISPLKSLSLHLTNINSSYGLSPFIDVKNLWDENK